jgi:hypothetical protein
MANLRIRWSLIELNFNDEERDVCSTVLPYFRIFSLVLLQPIGRTNRKVCKATMSVLTQTHIANKELRYCAI